MRAILKKLDIVDYPVSFNLESDNRDHLIGNLTSALMRDEKKMIGARWDGFDEVQQTLFYYCKMTARMMTGFS